MTDYDALERLLADMRDRDAQTGPVEPWGSKYDHSRIQRSAYHRDSYELAAGDRHILLRDARRVSVLRGALARLLVEADQVPYYAHRRLELDVARYEARAALEAPSE